ncbi:TrmH family RNA methyltransferase [Streptomyces sp. NPDC048434]|uniref:TrmH family RNA methyltransferase n=1 Tax=Streptomyces sp. NPDC048434 TaxID=3365549 RepID=UPI00371BDD30
MELIDSIKDVRIAAARTLATRSGRIAAGRCLIEGPGLIRQLLAAGTAPEYVLRSAGADDPALHAELTAAEVRVHAVRDGLLRKVTGGGKPVDWLAVAALPAETPVADAYGDFAVVCEQVADPGNLGTIVRTARALGVRDIVLTDETTDLSSRRVLDAARGAVLGCRVRRFADPGGALASLRESGFQIVVTSPRGTHLQSMAPLRGRKVALVVGNETDGVSAATLAAADLVVQIPMAGAVESLNVGVAAGISIYELRMKAILAMLTDRIRDTLGRNLTAAAHLVRQAFDAHLRRIGDLDSSQAVLLMVLACERSTPLEQLRRDVGVGTDELQALLAPLCDRGYVTQGQDDVTITREGEQAIAALWAVQERVEDGLYDGFTPAERDQLRELLHRVQNNAVRLASSPVGQGVAADAP